MTSVAAGLIAVPTAGATERDVAAVAGAGATVPAPIYRRWFDRFGPLHGLRVVYGPVGSGAGVSAIRDRRVDFGGTDVPLSAEEAAAGNLVQFASVNAVLVFAVNLPQIDASALTLPRPVLVDIFAGRIRVWSDARIAAANAGQALPDLAITPVVRGDRSGTSIRVGEYLSRGTGEAVDLATPFGLAAVGARGVALTVKRLPGAIGFMEASVALGAGLPAVALGDREGRAVRLSERSLTEAAEALSGEDDPEDRPGAWPLVTPSYVLLPGEPARRDTGRRLASLFLSALAEGDPEVWQAGFVPVSPASKTQTFQRLAAAFPEI